jgi:hypothetical protein
MINIITEQVGSNGNASEFYIRQVSGSNLDRDSDCPDWG